eukprot:TRINITY_DN40833_c0_g1_i1.p1 TRINITY_DN40833_c0_g1~~TRINITY_DN40833_c0_g1_i1.p1  ORF type:complete len:1006 (-),score=247.84 TRINITY_DN40833_c0_g1_i1:297-3314(-)
MEPALNASSDAAAPGVVQATVHRLLHPVASVLVDTPRDTFHEACASEALLKALAASAGDWIVVCPRTKSSSSSSPPAPGRTMARRAQEERWCVRLVEAGQAAVCAAVATGGSSAENALHLPANLLEALRATPGRSTVRVQKLTFDAGRPPAAAQVQLSQVQTPQLGTGSSTWALRSYFTVPRLLRRGEVFGVPIRGLPERLAAIEGCTQAAGCSLDDAPPAAEDEEEGQDAEEDPALAPAVRGAECSWESGDPLSGHAFVTMLYFRVESISRTRGKTEKADECLLVSGSETEVTVKGHASARATPLMRGHFFGCQPSTLPRTLRAGSERLIGVMASFVKGWMQQQQPGSGAAAVSPPSTLISGPRGCGKRLLCRAVCEKLGLHLLEVNCYSLSAQHGGAVEEALEQLVRRAVRVSPAMLCLRRLNALTMGSSNLSPTALLLLQKRIHQGLSDTLAQVHASHASSSPSAASGEAAEMRPLVALVATCEDVTEIGGPIRKAFHLELAAKRPDEEDRAKLLTLLLEGYAKSMQTGSAVASADETKKIAKMTAGLGFAELRSLCSEVAMCPQPQQASAGLMEKVEAAVKRLQGGSKVAVTLASKVSWNDVGGLQDAKDEIMNCITMPLTEGDAAGGEKLRSGVLLFGPPGTGKTLLAKAVATECRVHFLSVKGPELLSMYIGESEKNVRTLFQSARDLAPCVIFFDELDSLAPARGGGSDSGGVMDRVVSQLVTELDGLPATIFMIGATNRPDLLDRGLLRPGRLDRMVYLGIAQDKLPLLAAVCRKFELEDLDGHSGSGAPADSAVLKKVADACPVNLTGADCASLCQSAYGLAQKERIALMDDLAAKVAVNVTTLLNFLDALEKAGEAAVCARVGDLRSREDLELLFPRPSLATAEKVSTKLALHRCRQRPQVYAFIHSEGAADASGEKHTERHGGVLLVPAGEEAPASLTKAGDWTTIGGLCPFTALRVRVGLRHFQEALRQLQPSVPVEDLQKYQQLQAEYQNIK